MIKTAEIDLSQSVARPPASSGSAGAALAVAVALHALVICVLGAIAIHPGKPAQSPPAHQLEADFVPSPPAETPTRDRPDIRSTALRKPPIPPAATEPQIIELSNSAPAVTIPDSPAFTATEDVASQSEFGADFIPKEDPPPGAGADTPTSPKVSKPTAPAPGAAPRGRAPAPRASFVQAKVLRTERPSFPESARRRGLEGTTYVRLAIDAGGRVTSTSIATSSGNSAFDAAALRAAAKWRFEPASSDGSPTASQIIIPIRFKLGKHSRISTVLI